MMQKHDVLESYSVNLEEIEIEIHIIEEKKEFVRQYYLNLPHFGAGTEALLKRLKTGILSETNIQIERSLDAEFIKKVKNSFRERAFTILKKEIPDADEKTMKTIVAVLLQEMLGLGPIEFMLADPNLEEIVVNQSKEPVWVYHKKYGWLRTNISIKPEEEIENYANIIARRVGKQVTTLNPLLDAHLVTGDRANATLFPISTKGNTITIRRFRRDPWTVTDFIKNKTTSSELMALIWTAMQYEMNIVLSGGTASGKTSFMNICMPFIQPNHRVISIEDTREMQLPEYLHWVPLTTREPNAEGKGGVKMLDLLVNSLRMRPDRIIVGEIRRQREAEVLFEAMHTGHSAYTTFHATTAEETVRRLTNPPILVPPSMLDAIHLNVVMFRNRRLGVRRVLQVGEILTERRGETESVKANVLYRWKPTDDTISKHSDSIRLYDELGLHTGLSYKEIEQELEKKKKILDYMVKNDIHAIGEVGAIMAKFYMDEKEVVSMVEKNKKMEIE